MKFTVTWHPAARDELAQIWLDSSDREVVSTAANGIDQALSRDPDRKGEEFYGDRLFVSAPLAVTFAVFPEDCVVQVLQVWRH